MPSVGYVWLRGTSGFKARRRHPRSVTVIPWTDVVVVAPLGEDDGTAVPVVQTAAVRCHRPVTTGAIGIETLVVDGGVATALLHDRARLPNSRSRGLVADILLDA